MPFKDKEKRKEASKQSMEKKRKGLTLGINKEGLTEEGLTKDGTYFKDGVETVLASYVEGNKRRYGFLPDRPRYLMLSDDQVLDRANQPEAKKILKGMMGCNDAYFNRLRVRYGGIRMDSVMSKLIEQN